MPAPLQASSPLGKLVWRDVLHVHTSEDQGYSSPRLCRHRELSWVAKGCPKTWSLAEPIYAWVTGQLRTWDAPYSLLFWGP